MPPIISISKRGPGVNALNAKLARLARTDVLVGIPAAKNPRKGEKIGNAQLMYILTKGSPARKIPATPIIEPAIELNPGKAIISDELGDAAKAMLDSDSSGVIKHLRLAGTAGMNAAKSYFLDPRNNWPPNKPSTIRRKKSENRNIDSGALRRAITYVVREET